MWASLWVSKLVSNMLPSIFQFLIGVVSVSTAKYAAIIASLEVPLTLVGWTFVSFITFYPIMTQNPPYRATGLPAATWLQNMYSGLGGLVICALVFLAEKTFIQAVAVSFHKTSYEARIQESKHGVQILQKLFALSRSLFPAYSSEFQNEDIGLAQTQIGFSGSPSGTSTPRDDMKKAVKSAKKVLDKTTAVLSNVAGEITGRPINSNFASAHAMVVEALKSPHSSVLLARRIWFSLVEEGKEALTVVDLSDLMPQTEAQEALDVLDADNNGDLTLEEIEVVIVEIGKERISLSKIGP